LSNLTSLITRMNINELQVKHQKKIVKTESDISILIVDDNKDNLYSLKSLLEIGNDYRILITQSGEECLKIAIKEPVTIIILDVQMPGMDGYEVAKILKANAKTKKIPLIFITAVNHEIRYFLRGFDAGALDYIFKPIEPEILKAKVKTYISLAQAQNALSRLNNDLESMVAERTRQLEERNLELEKMYKVLDNFLHVTAHDFRAPLANINLVTELLKTSDNKEQQLHLIQTLNQIATRLDETVKGIVEMMEVQEKRHSPVKQINLNEVFENIRKEILPQLENIDGEIISDFSQASSFYYIPVYIESIFRNILHNSLKYRSPKRKLVINVNANTDGEYSVVEISDNGIGIDLEKYGKKIFSPFTRVNRSIDGKGLGLHLVKNMIEMNNGRIEIFSTPDKGTSLKLFLKNYSK